MNKTIEFIKTNLQDKTVILGCSYGPDSMCLLDILLKEKVHVICAHVNHNIREESKDEAESLRTWCNKNHITFELCNLQKTTKNEEYYRKKRLDFLKKTADKYNTNIILTAHHGDDLMETILMRLTRGSSFSGYGGFRLINKEDYTFIKPLIYYTKDEIIHYNNKNKIPYAEDKTNFTDKYKRNRFRKYILPFLKNENKKVNEKFLDFSKEIYETEDFLNGVVLTSYNKAFKKNVLNLEVFNKFPIYLKKRVLEKILKTIYGDDINKVSKKHVEKIVELSIKNGTFSYNLPRGFTVLKEYDKLLFGKGLTNDFKPYNIVFDDSFSLCGHKITKLKQSNENNNFVLRLNSTMINLPLHIRCRKNADKITVKNSDYEKKLKKVFIDKKVPKTLRSTYPIVTDNEDVILWIPGVVKSKFDMDYNQKYDIILKYERKDEINCEEK